MTDLIPRDAALKLADDATYETWEYLSDDLRAIPAIDPATIREAALREAADELRGLGYSTAVRFILALIGEKK